MHLGADQQRRRTYSRRPVSVLEVGVPGRAVRLRVQSVSVIRPSSIADLLEPSGLSGGECRAIHDEAYRLMVGDRAIGVGQDEDEDGIKCVYVLDVRGNRYTVVRNAGAYLLLDPALGIIEASKRFDDVLEVLRNAV